MYDCSGIRFQNAADHADKGGFSITIWSDNANTIPFKKIVAEILNKDFAIKGLGNIFDFNDLFTKPRRKGRYFHFAVIRNIFAVFQFLKPVDTKLLFGASCSCTALNPCKFLAVEALAFAFCGKLHFFSLCFEFQILGIVCWIGIQFSVIKFYDAVYHPFQEITVMSDHQDSPGKALEIAFQPVYHFAVNVVGRLVQNQYLCLSSKSARHGYTALLTAR